MHCTESNQGQSKYYLQWEFTTACTVPAALMDDCNGVISNLKLDNNLDATFLYKN